MSASEANEITQEWSGHFLPPVRELQSPNLMHLAPDEAFYAD
jgi:hypothetical protein